MSTTISTSYTAEDLLTMPDGDLYELVDGQLVERDMGIKSSWIAGQLFGLLTLHLRNQDRQLGWVFPSDSSYQCFPNHPNRVRKPDVSFLQAGRLPDDELPDGHLRIAPDLVAEVVSPNDLYGDVIRKVFEYLDARVPLIWVIDPATRTLMVYRADGSVQLLKEDDQLSGESVLAGFACPVAEIFPPRPKSDAGNGDINNG